MKKLFFLFSLITIVGLWATPLNRQVKGLKKSVAAHGQSEIDSWGRIRRLDNRITKLEKHFADSPSKNTDLGDTEDESEKDENE